MKFAHLSDLHFGLSQRAEQRAAALCRSLREADVQHVIVSGDITHRGRRDELRRFEETFDYWFRNRRITVVPGNHDRLGDDLGEELSGGLRVGRAMVGELAIIRVDSTGPHNRRWLASHGQLGMQDLSEIDRLLAASPPGFARIVVLHHHPLPLPHDTLTERLVSRFHKQSISELPLGAELVRRLCGTCDFLLHGHRHVPRELCLCSNERPRPMRIYNAGSSTELGRVRVFSVRDGRLVGNPVWLTASDELSPRRPARASRPTFGWPIATQPSRGVHRQDQPLA